MLKNKNKDNDIIQVVFVHYKSQINIKDLFYYIIKELCSLSLNYILDKEKIRCENKFWFFDPKIIFFKVKNNDHLMEIYNKIINDKKISAKMLDNKLVIVEPCQYIILKNYIKRLRRFEFK